MGNDKKNPYVMTIGFDRMDPRHVKVADYLNSLPRKKAQCIVEAVSYYLNAKGLDHVSDYREIWEEKDKSVEKQNTLQYETVRKMVLQVLEEQVQMESQNTELFSKIQEADNYQKKKETDDGVITRNEEDIAEIRNVLSAFRNTKN